MKRQVELVIVSDFHLGTYGCRAEELLKYLDSIQPKTLILNGDIIDMWQFKKRFFPKTHLTILKKISNFVTEGTKVIYITGNHDETLRKFTDFHMDDFSLVNKVVLELDGKKAWIFHGDVFDASIQHSKWLAKLGGWGYDTLIRINNVVNWILIKMGKEKYSLSKKIKASVKNAVKYISDFEETASELAIENGYDYVICGHIHQPQKRTITNKLGSTLYLNSGDWIESLSALEYHNKEWNLFLYDSMKDKIQKISTPTSLTDLNYQDLRENVIVNGDKTV
ncbi:MAG: UDP-2,3-diacylglucosamine diphosphatase [Flavobacteriaceae bacterium]|nr:UDP-2,3-diacylglucosamine diphosphatase [Flavobacteriaceae bacterium]